MEINIKQVSNSYELNSVYKLTYETFRERRLCSPQLDGKLINNIDLDFDPRTRILIATLEEEVIGTLSYTSCTSPQELYNYHTFSGELDKEVLPDNKGFSVWRMATKSGFAIQPLVLMMLIRKVMKMNLIEKNPIGYCSVMAEDMAVYEKILQEVTLISTRRKKTKEIDGELSYFRMNLNQSHVDILTRRINIMTKRYSHRLQKAG
ncbi:hypothetical protein N9933_00320 [bacterium]|nr:hypothetical protein [bacterium]